VARIPAVQERLDLTEGELGLALFGAAAGTLAGLPLAGRFVSATGSRRTVIAGVPLFAAALPLLALASNLVVLAAALVAFGAVAAALDVAMNAHGLELERRYGRPVLSGFHAAWSFGGLFGAGVGALAASADVGSTAHFTAVAAAIAVGGLVTSRLLLASEASGVEPHITLRRPSRALVPLGLIAFCGLFAEGAAADWSAVYLAGPVGTSAGVAALGYASFSLAMAAFRLAGDPLTTRWGATALTRRGALVSAAGLAAALVVTEPAVVLVGFACWGAGLAALVPVAFRAAGSVPGIPSAAGIAAVTTVGYSGFLVGPPTIGALAEVGGLRVALVLVLGLLLLLAALADRVSSRP
jgi:MFS family permease